MSYPAGDLEISLYDMQHPPALSWETPKPIDLGALISRLVAPWILSLLVATWPQGAGTDESPRYRRSHYVIPAPGSHERNRRSGK